MLENILILEMNVFSEKNNKMLLEGLELSTFAYPNTAYNYDALTEWATGAT